MITNHFPNIEILDRHTMAESIDSDVNIFIHRVCDSTAFNEVVVSDKPMILINDTTFRLTKETKAILKNRVSFVDCHYKNGLGKINKEQLKQALNREYSVDYEFIKRYQ